MIPKVTDHDSLDSLTPIVTGIVLGDPRLEPYRRRSLS